MAQNTDADLTVLISAIDPIEHSSSVPLTPGKLESYVEAPVLAACRKLYDMGIRTVTATANRKDLGRTARITVDMESLCTVNDERFRMLAKNRPGLAAVTQQAGKPQMVLSLPVNSDTTARDISEDS